MHSSVTDCVVALYPSPAGATESELHFETWRELRVLNPVLDELEQDAEALIVNRLSDPPSYAIAPIDRAYMLVGLVKSRWEGISGGAGVDEAVAGFFDELRSAAAAGMTDAIEIPADAGVPEAPEPEIEVIGASARRYAAVPILDFDLQVSEPGGRQVYLIALSVQVMIEAARRSYDAETRERLVELFGPPERWATTTRSLLWTQVDVLVPTFTGSTTFRVPVACSYDLELAAAKYFHAVRDGEVPLAFNFNGTIYYRGDDGRLQMALVPWSCSAEYRLPLGVWHELIDHYYPNSGWVRAQHRHAATRCRREKARRGLPTFDACVAQLLEERARERRARAAGRVAALRGLRALPVHARGDQERDADAVRDRLPARLRAPRRQHLRRAADGVRAGGAARGRAERRGALPAAERARATRRPRAARSFPRRRSARCSRASRSSASPSTARTTSRSSCGWRCRPSASTTAACAWRWWPRTAARRAPSLDRAGALRRSFLSTHPLLRVSEGRFVSPLDAGAACTSVNTWPVLASAEDDVLLGAAIVLPDHPQLAPESLRQPVRPHRDRGGAAAPRPDADRRGAGGDRGAGPGGDAR